MLIAALVLAVIGLAALVSAVVTSNELIAWVCIGASGLGVLLLVVDAIRDRVRRAHAAAAVVSPVETTEVIEPVETTQVIEPLEATEVIAAVEDETGYSAETFAPAEDLADDGDDVDENLDEYLSEEVAEEDHPDELVHDEPDYDTPSDDEPEFPEPAEEAAIHTVGDSEDLAEEPVEDLAEESTTDVRYVPSAEDSGPTVVYTYSESAETEYVDTEDSPDVEERPDR